MDNVLDKKNKISTDVFWTQNPTILFDREKITDLIPREKMSMNEKLNALSKGKIEKTGEKIKGVIGKIFKTPSSITKATDAKKEKLMSDYKKVVAAQSAQV